MGEQSGIEWTDSTWNPVSGCTQVSPGCAHCYAKRFAERFEGVPNHPYSMGFEVTLWPERLVLPAQWKGSKRIFVNSMSDLFHEQKFLTNTSGTSSQSSQMRTTTCFSC